MTYFIGSVYATAAAVVLTIYVAAAAVGLVTYVTAAARGCWTDVAIVAVNLNYLSNRRLLLIILISFVHIGILIIFQNC